MGCGIGFAQSNMGWLDFAPNNLNRRQRFFMSARPTGEAGVEETINSLWRNKGGTKLKGRSGPSPFLRSSMAMGTKVSSIRGPSKVTSATIGSLSKFLNR